MGGGEGLGFFRGWSNIFYDWVVIKSGVLGMNVSEHDAIFCSLINQRPVSHLKNIKFRDHSNQSLSSLKQHLFESLASSNVLNNFSIDEKFKL